MPLLKQDLNDLDKCQADLRNELKKVGGKAVAFAFVRKHQFGGKTAPLLVVGDKNVKVRPGGITDGAELNDLPKKWNIAVEDANKEAQERADKIGPGKDVSEDELKNNLENLQNNWTGRSSATRAKKADDKVSLAQTRHRGLDRPTAPEKEVTEKDLEDELQELEEEETLAKA